MTVWPNFVRSVSFIRVWKVAGALQSPNGIASHSYFPHMVLKADFDASSGFSRTCQYSANIQIQDQLSTIGGVRSTTDYPTGNPEM